jgi:predicted acyl esterase
LTETWLEHQHKDEYWKHGSVGEDYSAIKAAVFAVGGWNDAYKNAVPALLENLSSPSIGLVGPWLHKYPHFAIPDPAIGFLQESLRWWNHWLKGIETGIMDEPRYRAFMLESEPAAAFATIKKGRWIAENIWPSDEIVQQKLFLTANGLAKAANESGGEVGKVNSPQDLGQAAGEYCQIWLGPEAPGDQRIDNGGAALFESDCLDESIEIFGAPILRFGVSVDRSQGNLYVRLNKVDPTGSVSRVTYAVLNLSHRHSNETPEIMPVGEVQIVSISMDHIAQTFAAGDKIQLAVSTTCWPLIWPSPEAVTATIHLDPNSWLELPVRPVRDEAEIVMPPPECSKPAEHEKIRIGQKERYAVFDQKTGLSHFHILDDDGVELDVNTGLEIESIAREHYQIDPCDPLTARADIHWTTGRARGEWRVRTETKSSMKCDREYFHVEASLEAFEGDQMIFTKEWKKSIRRNLV